MLTNLKIRAILLIFTYMSDLGNLRGKGNENLLQLLVSRASLDLVFLTFNQACPSCKHSSPSSSPPVPMSNLLTSTSIHISSYPLPLLSASHPITWQSQIYFLFLFVRRALALLGWNVRERGVMPGRRDIKDSIEEKGVWVGKAQVVFDDADMWGNFFITSSFRLQSRIKSFHSYHIPSPSFGKSSNPYDDSVPLSWPSSLARFSASEGTCAPLQPPSPSSFSSLQVRHLV